METTRNERITIVNKIIQLIASLDRKFFEYDGNISHIFNVNDDLYMRNEYNGFDMLLTKKHPEYQPKGWTHGGTIWGLTKDFREFILTGEKTNGNSGYGGLYSIHWGYESESMDKIRELATELNYL